MSNNILRSFTDLDLVKGNYKDNNQNRKKGRVGQEFKKVDPMKEVSKKRDKKEVDENKGMESAMKIVSEWRSGLFKEMNDDQLQDFRKTMANALDLKMK